jgi:hypothetical protein
MCRAPITRCITLKCRSPALPSGPCQVTSNGCPCSSPRPRPGAGSAVLAGELLGRVRAELPAVGELGEREQVLVSAWLTGLRSARTRRAYAGDVAAWLG